MMRDRGTEGESCALPSLVSGTGPFRTQYLPSVSSPGDRDSDGWMLQDWFEV